ncbi:hypothetical protein [Chitinophaga varians]|uniref:hypothetical protein n=1 Tax=Chitinophaga varians TaxID=2202339 RepID=UPI00165FE89E|nr:hypothetical protein [Chitinophaga varians]MBC9909299.1 hypothetical protein [Chitinophaga varians]
MRKLNFLIPVMILFLYSCNYALFVPKHNVLHVCTGYLMYYNNREYFFPEKNIRGNNFFSKKVRKNGYILRVNEWGENFSSIGQKYIIGNYYPVKDTLVLIEDSVSIIPVETVSVSAGFKRKGGTAYWRIRYGGRDFFLNYAGANHQYVWRVYPILDSDKSARGVKKQD